MNTPRLLYGCNRTISTLMAVFWVPAGSIFRATMEAARTSETLVNFYQTTRRYNPQDSHLRTHRRENLKSYLFQPYAFTSAWNTVTLIC
jgi:hypothetical protein